VKRLLAAAALVVVALASLAVFAAPASAHAELERTTPESNAELPAGQPPGSVTLEFTEGVQLPEGAIVLLDRDGSTVSGVGEAEHGDTNSVVTTTLPDLDDGTYVVDWHVVSADSHPIQGAFTFSVGTPTATADEVAGLVAGSDDHGVGIAFGVTRALAFGSVLVLVGGIVFLRVCAPDSGTDSGVRALLWICWLVAFLTSFIGIGMQAAYTSGQDFEKFWDPTAIGDVLDTRFGQSWLMRAGLLLLVLPALRHPERARSTFVNFLDGVLAGLVLVTFTFSGHARTGRYILLATITDLVHLAAAAVWLGGIAVLATLLVRRVVPHDATTATTRFSRIAGPAIVVVAISGAVQAWRQTDGLDSLFDTTYGRLLLTKVGLVVLIVAAASVSRHIVTLWAERRLAPAGPGAARVDADPEDVRELRNAVIVEVAIAVMVLAVTSVLVNTTPARVEGSGTANEGTAGTPVPPAGYEESLEDDGLTFDITLTPALAGLNTLTVAITDANGRPFEPIEMSAQMTNIDRDVVLPADLGPEAGDGPGVYAGTVNLLFTGEWELEIRALRTDIDQSVVTATIDVG
jgi:copper transport protein